MKTFIVLFIIAASLPAEAQRVRENVRQRAVITQGPTLIETAEPVEPVVVVKPGKNGDAKRKK